MVLYKKLYILAPSWAFQKPMFNSENWPICLGSTSREPNFCNEVSLANFLAVVHNSYYLWLNVFWGSSHWILSLELLLKCVSFIADGKRFQGNKSVLPVSVVSRSCFSTWSKTPSAFTCTNNSTVILWCSVFLFCTCYQEADLHCIFCCFLVWAWNFLPVEKREYFHMKCE